MSAFFPDTTVLVNFQIIGRWDVLAALVKDGGRWVASVEDECRDWVRTYPDIHGSAAAIFGEAVRPEPAEFVDVRVARDAMADPADDHPRKHLGEAETIAIVRRRFQGSRFITDDRNAQAVAKANGIQCYGTGDLLLAAERTGLITVEERASYLAVLRRNGRHLLSVVR